VFQTQNLLATILFSLFCTAFRQRWREILLTSSIGFFATQVIMQLILSAYEAGTIMVEIGQSCVFSFILIFITYNVRLNYRKAFEMTIRAEKASQNVNDIFNSLPDSVLLISKTKNDSTEVSMQ
jgi:hypothetical protein